MSSPPPGPPLPTGRRLHLRGRGTTFVRELAGPSDDAPTLLLVHGWMASAGLNWFQAFDALRPHFRVIAPDLRGHGRGIRSRRRFRIADCADDLAALLDHLEAGPVIAVGYSLGGPVSQMLWRRHPHHVEGLVQFATFDRIAFGHRSRIMFGSMMAAAAGTSQLAGLAGYLPTAGARLVGPRRPPARAATMREWAGQEMRRHDWTQVMQAGVAMSNFSSRRWIGEIDVPSAVVVTELDRAVLADKQLRFAARFAGARVFRHPGGHVACAEPGFGDAVLAPCTWVARQAGHAVPTLTEAG